MKKSRPAEEVENVPVHKKPGRKPKAAGGPFPPALWTVPQPDAVVLRFGSVCPVFSLC